MFGSPGQTPPAAATQPASCCAYSVCSGQQGGAVKPLQEAQEQQRHMQAAALEAEQQKQVTLLRRRRWHRGFANPYCVLQSIFGTLCLQLIAACTKSLFCLHSLPTSCGRLKPLPGCAALAARPCPASSNLACHPAPKFLTRRDSSALFLPPLSRRHGRAAPPSTGLRRPTRRSSRWSRRR